MNESNFDKCQLEMTWNVFITRLSVLNVILTDDIIASPGVLTHVSVLLTGVMMLSGPSYDQRGQTPTRDPRVLSPN